MSSLLLSALLTVGTAVPPPPPPPRYVLEEIQPYGLPTRVWGLNDHGAVVGRAGQRGFIWDAGTVTDLPGPLPGHSYTEGRGISNSGFVAYNSQHTNPYTGVVTPVGFLWEAGETQPARGRIDAPETEVLSIREPDVVYGRGIMNCEASPLQTWFAANSTLHLFWPNMTGKDARQVSSAAGWVESVDEVVTSFRFDLGSGNEPVVLPTFGGVSTKVNDALSFTECAGWSETASGERHPFMFINDTMYDFGTLTAGTDTEASALEHVRFQYIVVGTTASPPRAWVSWGGELYALEDLVVGGTDLPLAAATDINTHGQIIVNTDEPSNTRRGVLLTPLPAGDVNLDFVVDNDDLLAVMAGWGPCDDRCPADLDGDGLVGQSDLDLVLGSWTE